MDGQGLAEAAAAAVARIERRLGAEVVPPGDEPVQLLAPAAALVNHALASGDPRASALLYDPGSAQREPPQAEP